MRYLSPVMCCALLVLTSQIGKAQTTFTSYSSGNPLDHTTFQYLSGTVGLKSPQTVDFESLANGTSVTSSTTFNSSTATQTGLQISASASTSLSIQNTLTTTSGTQYLAGSGTNLIPATTTLTFTPTDKPISAFGLYLLANSGESFTLTATKTTGGTYVANSGAALSTGPNLYFLGFIDTASVYSSVTLSISTGGVDYYIDDVRYTAAPELHYIVAIAAAFLLTLKCFLGRIGLGVL